LLINNCDQSLVADPLLPARRSLITVTAES